ncbi:hypothetical protein NC661_11210 [Aquibacillus koreensis]|uniref:Uncharacterized protein n=1 Tax=Aquibacillus koreensis TaxID=279446 RepID=A0A9X4AIA1_9BACI|nr:hypothetical protein [Aquibacillus koreensis]MCT2537716.1 hypothetical protein [Aquibacillus koreensis]MDC3420937.1 hypothetical protein [Aquibacillus koreensis]
MTLPVNFDHNEIVILIGLIASFIIVCWLPKRFSLSFSVLVFLFATTIARLSDHLISGSIVDLYDVMDSGKYEIFDLLTYIYYGPFAYFFIYVYDKFNIKGLRTVLYIIVCTVLATLFEGFHVFMEVFQYKGWHLWYSFSFYLIIQPITLIFYHFLKRLYDKR